MNDFDPSPQSANPLLAQRTEGVLTVTLNRPDRLNAVSLTLYRRLVEELEAADMNADVRCVVLTGAGRAFCAGADLKAHAEKPMPESDRESYTEMAQRANELLQRMRVPVVAAVNGHAIGAGLELALSADLMIVAENAKLRLPEVALGTFVGGGVVYTLAERVGILRAREIVYFGDFFSGDDAARMGLANRAVAAVDVVPMATSWAERLAKQAPLSLSAAKRLIGPASRRTPDEALREERAVLDRIFRSADWREGLAAFHEGRDPVFRGE